MSQVLPFRGFRFNPGKVESLSHVITPPFDVISPDEREILAQKSPHNMVHLLLPKEADGNDKYTVAGKLFDQWVQQAVLQQDEQPAYYILEQRFKDLKGADRVRNAFFASVKIPEPGENTVLGHERTFEYKITDRLALTTATRANTGAVFVMYRDPERVIAGEIQSTQSTTPAATFETFDGVSCKLWLLPGSAAIKNYFENQTLYIADGHHRFATACAYRDRMREKTGSKDLQPFDYMLMGLVAVEDPGLLVYPAHRVLDSPNDFNLDAFLDSLRNYFEVQSVQNGALAEAVTQSSECALGLVVGDEAKYLLTLKPSVNREEFLGSDHGPEWRALDVAVLHRGILERILNLPENTEFVYEPFTDKALSRVESGDKDLAFLLKGAPPQQILACSEAGEYMPQKATYLFPKLPSGAVMHRLE